MSQRIRPEGAAAFYRPDRDMAYFGPALLKRTAVYINKSHWPVLIDHVALWMGTQDTDAAWNAVVEAHDAFYRYLEACCEKPQETPSDVLRRIGWEDIHEGARFAYYAILGVMMSTKLFSALRDEHLEGDKVSLDRMAMLAFEDIMATTNHSTAVEEVSKVFRRSLHACRKAGLSYDDILTMVNMERLGGLQI